MKKLGLGLEKCKNKKRLFINTLIIQVVVIVYTLSTVMAKNAANCEFMSPGFIGFYALEIFILGIYAILWQQIIKRFDLSVAYANRSISLLWSMLWASIFFSESISIQNIIGVIIVIIGTIIVNSDE